MTSEEKVNPYRNARVFWKMMRMSMAVLLLFMLTSSVIASERGRGPRSKPPQLGPGRGLADDARRGAVCWDYFNGIEHLLLKLRMVQFERTSSYQAFGILFTEEGPYPINGNGELTGEEFQMTLTLNAFLPEVYVSSVQYAIRLNARTLDGQFDSIAPTLFPNFEAFRISGALTYQGNDCALKQAL